MEAMRQSWTDDRLDDLSRRMDERFDHVESEMKAGFARVDARFGQVDTYFERVDAHFERVDARFERVDARFERVERTMQDGFERVGKEVGACEIKLAAISGAQDSIREAIAEMHADNRQLHNDLYALQRMIVRIGFGLVFSLVAVLGLLVTNS